jgi:hypothetical protein
MTSQMDNILEYQRLLNVHQEALRGKDTEAIDHAAHEMATFLRLNGQGRLAKWFASRAARQAAREGR